MKRIVRVAAPVLIAVSLAGCGLFKSSGSGGKYEPNDPNRPINSAHGMVANLVSTSPFNAPDNGKKATFHALLRDEQDNQFYGPTVTLDDKTVGTTNQDSSTIYELTGIDVVPGKTYVTTVQGHSATSPPQMPQLTITSPVPAKDTSNNVLAYYNQNAGQGVTVTWQGGDPAQPVYIFVQDLLRSRRLFMSEDTTAMPNDPENFGKPLPNTGSFSIPTTVTQRVQSQSGNISTQTLTVFDATGLSASQVASYAIYVVQRSTTDAPPIRFSVVTSGSAVANVVPPTGTRR